MVGKKASMNLLRKKQQRQGRRTALMGEKGRAPAFDDSQRYAFRRNRTLTGSLSSDVSSVSEHNSQLQSTRVQAHHLRRHRRRLGVALFAVFVVAAGLAWMIWQSIVTVSIITDNSASQPLSTKPYIDEIQRYLSSHPLERNRVSFNSSAVSAYLQNHGFPEINNVSLDPAHHQIGAATLRVTMRKPVVSWKTGALKLYVDQDGIAFTRNYYQDPTVEVVDQTGIQAVNNQVLASNRFLGFIGLIIGHLHDQGLSVSQVILPADTTHQLLVSMQGVAYPVKISVDRPAADQAEDTARAVRYLTSKGIAPKYLDVRISGRAYYQ
jgi:hypothetical protein